MVRTEIRDRAIPWTQLILRSSLLQNDLNMRHSDRASVGLSYAALLAVTFALTNSAVFAVAALPAVALFLVVNSSFYRFFVARRGVGFALRVVPLHLLHYVCSGFSFVVGCGIFVLGRGTGLRVPGLIPIRAWTRAFIPRTNPTVVPQLDAQHANGTSEVVAFQPVATQLSTEAGVMRSRRQV